MGQSFSRRTGPSYTTEPSENLDASVQGYPCRHISLRPSASAAPGDDPIAIVTKM